MRGREPFTVAELAEGGFNLRYTAEILGALAAAGIVEYQPGQATFFLSDEHAAVVADPSSPYLLAGWFDMIPAGMRSIDEVARAVRSGGGVPASNYDDRVVAGIDRLNSPGIRILLTRRWLPTMPDVVSRLETGGRIADVGCGSGTAAIAMAGAYPRSQVHGYDLDPRAIARANERAREVDLANLEFSLLAAEDLPIDPGFDLITTFDVIHDLSNPGLVLSQIRSALAPGGTYLMMEPAAGPRLEDNLNPTGMLNLAVSVLYCLPQSLVDNGAGLGTTWGPVKAEALCREVGFRRFQQLPIENPFSNFYRVEP
jgi:SAM-dependent methyltransferase